MARAFNNKGVILIISLWIMAILTIFAVSLGRRLSLEIKLLHNRIDGVKAFYIAKAGVQAALAERLKVLEKGEAIYADSFNQPWLNNEEAFKEINLGEGKFSVQNADEPQLYGISDESARININTAQPEILKALLTQTGLSGPESEVLSAMITQWRGANLKFDAIEEILSVEGMTNDIFYGKDINENGIIEPGEEGINKYITVYGTGAVNINTAPRTVLTTVLNTEADAAKAGLIDYIINKREQLADKPSVWFVNDVHAPASENTRNIAIDSANTNLDDDERGWIGNLKEAGGSITVVSQVFKIDCSASVKGIERHICAVVKYNEIGSSKPSEFIYWSQL